MGKIVRVPCSRTPGGGKGGGEAALKPTSFFSEGMGGFFMKWTYSTDVKGYRKVMIGGVQLDCEGCPKKVRLAIGRTDGVMQVRTDMENEIVYVMGKNINLSELRKNVRMESKFAEILDILPWKIKLLQDGSRSTALLFPSIRGLELTCSYIQKVVLKLSMEDAKKRAKAMKCAIGMHGVLSVSHEGDKMTVVGEGIDLVTLMSLLRKKMGYVELEVVTAVEEKTKEKKVKVEAEGKRISNQ